MPKGIVDICLRGIEWSMRALRFILRARAVITFVLRAASSLETGTGAEVSPHDVTRSTNSLFLVTVSTRYTCSELRNFPPKTGLQRPNLTRAH